jgi:hypothetical protein
MMARETQSLRVQTVADDPTTDQKQKILADAVLFLFNEIDRVEASIGVKIEPASHLVDRWNRKEGGQ